MLNVMVAENNTNEQYQDLVDPVKKIYKASSQMSIEFEVDGPYKVRVVHSCIRLRPAPKVAAARSTRDEAAPM
jgi:hypothetical protein